MAADTVVVTCPFCGMNRSFQLHVQSRVTVSDRVRVFLTAEVGIGGDEHTCPELQALQDRRRKS